MVRHELAKDVQGDFAFNLQNGASPQMIVAELREAYRPILYDPDVQALFTVTIAHEAWKTGRLYPELRDAALDCIAADLSRTQSPDRQAELSRLSETLCSIQPGPAQPVRDTFWAKAQRILQRGLSAVRVH